MKEFVLHSDTMFFVCFSFFAIVVCFLFCFLVKRAADEASSEAKKPRVEVNYATSAVTCGSCCFLCGITQDTEITVFLF